MSHFNFVHSCCRTLRLLFAAWLVIFPPGFARADEAARARIHVGVTGAGSVTPAGGSFAPGSTVLFSATPSAGFVFSHWTDAAGEALSYAADQPTLRYTVTGRAALQARFVRNPFARIAGTVNCWIRTFAFMPETGFPSSESRGLLAIAFTKTGGFSGRMIFDGEVLRVKGAMNGLGKAHLRLAKADGTTLRVELRMKVDDPADALDVAVLGGDYCALGSVGLTGSPALTARSSVVLSPAPDGDATPFGDIGYASLVRAASGAYRGAGRLGDGAAVSFGGRVVRDHFESVAALPVYARLGDGGILSGLIDFETNRDPGDRIAGTLQRHAAPAPAPVVPHPATTAARVYVSAHGDDANPGTRNFPQRSLQRALAQISGEGEIVMLAGDYEQEKLNLATARRLTIRSEPGGRVRVLFGGKVLGAAFTQHSGNVWKAAAPFSLPVQGTENRFWIFELGQPEGAAAPDTAWGLRRARDFRLEHFRLRQASSIAGVEFSNGSYFLADGVLYVRTSNGERPAAAQEFRIPSQDPADSFVFGATGQTDVSLEGIEVYFGMNNANFTGAGRYRAAGCMFFGAGNWGIVAVNARIGLEEECEYAANANDGSAATNYPAEPMSVTVLNAWSHDNGDEGHSPHVNCRGYYLGGLFENNASGGITPAIGATAVILGSRTRGNVGGISPAVEPDVHVFVSGWISSGDFDAIEQWTDGLATVVDSRIENLQRYALSAIAPAARIHAFNTRISGGQGITGGAGAAGIVVQTGRAEVIHRRADAAATNYNVAGSSQIPPRFASRVAPFGSRAPNGRIEIETLDSDGRPVSLLREDFYLDSANTIFIVGRNAQALRLAIDPHTGVFTGAYRDRLDPSARHTLGGIVLQEQRRGEGGSIRGSASDLVKISPL